MTDEVYDRILTYLQQIQLNVLIPLLSGEPFTDPKYIARLRLAREKLPNSRLLVISNGSLLTEKIIDELQTISDLDLHVSLNAWTADTRYRVMLLDDFDKVLNVLNYAEGKVRVGCTLIAHPSIPIEEAEEFRKHGGAVVNYHNWAGEQYYYKRTRPTRCQRVDTLTFNYKGDAVLCCYDIFGKIKFGNVMTNSLEEILTNPERMKYITMHNEEKGQELPMCSRCSDPWI